MAVNRIKPLGTFIVDRDEWEKFPNNYKALYDSLMEELKDDPRIDNIYFGYCEEVKGITIQIFTTRCTLFYTDTLFAPDHSNDKEVLYRVLFEWSRLPKDIEEKEQYTGVYRGMKISFNRVWSGHRFTDDECKKLLNGDMITISATNKNGQEYQVSGTLESQEYQNFKFWGFKPNFRKSIPEVFNGHRFSKHEIEELKSGMEVYVSDLFSRKKNKTYKAFLSFNEDEGIKMRFPQKPKLSYGNGDADEAGYF